MKVALAAVALVGATLATTTAGAEPWRSHRSGGSSWATSRGGAYILSFICTYRGFFATFRRGDDTLIEAESQLVTFELTDGRVDVLWPVAAGLPALRGVDALLLAGAVLDAFEETGAVRASLAGEPLVEIDMTGAGPAILDPLSDCT